MYDVPGFIKKYEKNFTTYIILFVILLVIFGTGYLFGIRNTGTTGSELPNDGAGISRIGKQIYDLETNQRSLTESISQSEDRAANFTERITGSQRRINDLESGTESMEDLIRESNQVIGECESILNQVKQRGKTATVKN